SIANFFYFFCTLCNLHFFLVTTLAFIFFLMHVFEAIARKEKNFLLHKIASIYVAIQQISFITIWPHHIELCFYIIMFCDILLSIIICSNPFLQNMMRDARMLEMLLSAYSLPSNSGFYYLALQNPNSFVCLFHFVGNYIFPVHLILLLIADL
ncbi:hypothetical protein ACJX0J_026877, partial [Zea mays]